MTDRIKTIPKGGDHMELICLGDSITYGYGVGSQRRWTTLVGQALGCTVANHGISGDTTGGMLVRLNTDILPELRRRPPSEKPLVLLMGGVNDIFYSGTDSGARVNMGAMVQQIITAGGRCVMLSPLGVAFSAVPSDWQEVMRPDNQVVLDGYHHWQQQFCHAFGVPYIELYDLLRDEYGTPCASMYLDGLHPTAEGHRLLAQRITEALCCIYPKKFTLDS